MKCRILPYAVADGPANMALDEALLDAAATGGEAAYLRCYGWTVPTLSLGYFQRLAEIRADPRWHSVAIVRRLTGGGAIWHHDELTYALAVPASHPQARPNTALYRAVHAAIAAVLAEAGVTASRWGDGTPARGAGRNRPALCFTDRDTEDIVFHGYKLVGSAQRRRHGAILQQGSLLLARSDRVPELRGVCDVADVPRSPEHWSGLLTGRIARALDLDPESFPAPGQVRHRASQWERTRYRNPSWTASRESRPGSHGALP
jgi:lipoate-protein ligase A